jgi:hypothetical protein
VSLTDTTRADEQAAELTQGHAHQMTPHTPPPPPAPDAEETARHRAGLARMRSHEPPDAIRALLRRVALCNLLWPDR